MSVQAIDRIQPLWTDLQTEGMRLDAGAEVGGTRRTQPTLFSDIFQSAIDRVRETDAAKNEVAYQLATGQLDNPAALMTSITEAQASLELLIQLRNKAVESYNELQRVRFAGAGGNKCAGENKRIPGQGGRLVEGGREKGEALPDSRPDCGRGCRCSRIGDADEPALYDPVHRAQSDGIK